MSLAASPNKQNLARFSGYFAKNKIGQAADSIVGATRVTLSFDHMALVHGGLYMHVGPAA